MIVIVIVVIIALYFNRAHALHYPGRRIKSKDMLMFWGGEAGGVLKNTRRKTIGCVC